MFFTGARTHADLVVGAPGEGWPVAMTLLGHERGEEAATNPILFRAELDRLLALAAERGRDHDPLIRQRLAWCYARVEIMRYLGYRILTQVQRQTELGQTELAGTELGAAASVAKLYWSEYHVAATELALDIGGLDGLVPEGRGPLRGAHRRPRRSQLLGLLARRLPERPGRRDLRRHLEKSSATSSPSRCSACPRRNVADPDEFGGRVALVTAAAGQGIGQAVARRLAAGGARVVVTDIHPGRTEKVTAAIAADYPAATVAGYPLDAGDRDQIDAVVNAVTTSLGPVRILVNNAAVNVVGSIFGYDPAHWDRVLRVNLTGPWYLCRRTMPLMRDAGGGVIVNVGSYAPDVGGGGIEAPYAASKGGLAALTRGLAHEGGPHRIRAVYLSMGVVKDTKFAADNADLLAKMPGTTGPLGDLPGPADIAEAVAFLASDRAAVHHRRSPQRGRGAYMRN